MEVEEVFCRHTLIVAGSVVLLHFHLPEQVAPDDLEMLVFAAVKNQ
jgi:hypothetical protein